jgi:hypothetical protein
VTDTLAKHYMTLAAFVLKHVLEYAEIAPQFSHLDAIFDESHGRIDLDSSRINDKIQACC